MRLHYKYLRGLTLPRFNLGNFFSSVNRAYLVGKQSVLTHKEKLSRNVPSVLLLILKKPCNNRFASQTGKFVYCADNFSFTNSWCTSEVNSRNLLRGCDHAIFANHLKCLPFASSICGQKTTRLILRVQYWKARSQS